MLGAIAGDIIGSVHEYLGIKTRDFPLFVPRSQFTDDSVLTVAVADGVLTGTPYLDKFHEYGQHYPNAGYGLSFARWLESGSRKPYNSWGNGSAMRVSPIGFAFNSLFEILEEAKRSAEVTHNHPEGIRGAQATASAIFMARQGKTKEEIRNFIEQTFHYDLSRPCDEIRPDYSFNESCQGTVPEAITAFLDSTGYEDAVRLAVSLGGDADTLACIAGGIAEAFYGGVPKSIADRAIELLDERLKNVLDRFYWKYALRRL